MKRTTSPSGGPLRIIIYVRVSSEEQAIKGLSLGDQSVFIKRALDQRYGVGNYQLVAELADPGLTGSLGPSAYDVVDGKSLRVQKKHRPGLASAIRMLLADEADVLAVYNFLRLYRDGTMGVSLVDQVMKLRGQDLFSAQEPVDVYTPAGMLQLAIIGATGKFQIASGNEVIRANLAERKRLGGWLGTPPYGWRWAQPDEQKNPRAKTIVAIPEQIEHIKEVAQLYLAGHSERRVAKQLNARGIPFIMKKQGSDGSRESTWTSTNVRILLKNPAHAGLLRLGTGELVQGLHFEDRAYDPSVFHLIQETISTRRTRFRGIRSERPDMLLGGLVHCGSCGEKLAARFSGGPRCYTCRGLTGDADTRHVWVDAETLEKAVLHEVQKLAGHPEVVREARTKIGLAAREGREHSRRELEQARDRLAAFEGQKKRALRQLRDQVLSEELFRMQSEEISSEEALVLTRARELERVIESGADVERLERRALEALESFPALWEHLEPCERAELLRAAIEKLEVHERGTHSEMVLKVHLMPEVHQLLPRSVAPRNVVATGPESLTLPELACLWHLAKGTRAVDAAATMGVTESTFSTLASRAAKRLGHTDKKKAAKAAGPWISKVQHLLPLTGAKRRRRQKAVALTAMEKTALELRQQGYSPARIAEQFGIHQTRVEALLASGDAKGSLTGTAA